MKKRVKLLTTIASLCLAVALMAFGVYAATSLQGKVSSTLTFTSSEIDGTWTLVSTSGAAESKTGVTLTKDATEVALNYSKDTPTASYTITFENTGNVNTAYVYLDWTAPTNAAFAATATQKVGEDEAAAYTKNSKVDVAKGETVTFVVTLTLTYDSLSNDNKVNGFTDSFSISGEALATARA